MGRMTHNALARRENGGEHTLRNAFLLADSVCCRCTRTPEGCTLKGEPDAAVAATCKVRISGQWVIRIWQYGSGKVRVGGLGA